MAERVAGTPPAQTRGGLSRNVVASLASACFQIAAALVVIPLIVDAVGKAGLGVWTLGQAVLLYVVTAEAGIGPSVQRFVAVARGGSDDERVVRLWWSTVLLYVVGGAVGAALVAALAVPLTRLFNIPAELESQAVDMFRLIGIVIALGLLAAAAANVLQGLERFVIVSLSSAAGSATFIVAVAVGLSEDGDLVTLAWAALWQQLVMLVLRLGALATFLRRHRPGVIDARSVRDLLAFAWRMQAVVASTIINNQTDRVVVGVISPAATVGQLGVASQVAEAGRLVAGAALTPVMNRLATEHGRPDSRLLEQYGRLNELWLTTVVTGATLGLFALHPLITAWLGDDFEDAVLFGAFLVVAYGANLATGVSVGYMRAVGQPGLEARYGMLLIALNLAGSVVLAILAGPYGVVAATMTAYILGTAWFFHRLRRARPELPPQPVVRLARRFVLAVVAGAGVLLAGEALVDAIADGFALVAVAFLALVAFAGLMAGTALKARRAT